MVLILLYFLFLLVLSSSIGMLTHNILKISSSLWIDKIWLGFVTITILAGIWAFFAGLDFYFLAVVVLLSGFSFWKYRLRFRQLYNKLTWKSLNTLTKVSVILLLLLLLVNASLSGYVLDNDSYYLQTIKWLNDYGLVPGIGNWHLFLAQQSGFHILEAGLNLEFLSLGFNDVGLFLTLIMMLWSVLPTVDEETFFQKAFRNLLVLILPVLMLLGTAPSPDIPVILLHYYVIYKFLFGNRDAQNLLIITTLTGLACYFKITSVFLGVLPLVLWFQLDNRNLKLLYKPIVIGVLFAGLFVGKNIVASGYPLFPLTFLSVDIDWLMPIEMAVFYSNATVAQAFGTTMNELATMNIWERLLVWIQHPGFEGLLNKIVAFVLFLSVIGLVYNFKNSKKRTVLVVFLSFSATLFMTSPQARFFLPFLFPIVVLLLVYTFSLVRKHSTAIAASGIVMGMFILILPSLISKMTDNQRMKNVPQFEVSNLWRPSSQSRFDSAFAKAKINNINYNDPQGDDFFYGTYNIPLPAAQTEYLEYFKTYYLISPEYRGDTAAAGFRAVRD